MSPLMINGELILILVIDVNYRPVTVEHVLLLSCVVAYGVRCLITGER
jgi:hypothetical protein